MTDTVPTTEQQRTRLFAQRLPRIRFRLSNYRRAIELTAIAIFWVLYCGFFIALEPNIIQSGVEHQRLSGVILPVSIGLERYGHIPTWNPYMGVGEPTLNNPFNYLFNPFMSLPVLLLGAGQGTKLATVLGLLIAGYSMREFMRVLGVGAVARVTAASLYMMSGGIAGKFFPGHFQLGLSLAYPPLVFAGLWWTLHSDDRRAPALMAAAFALLFFTGNIYYSLHTIICCGVIVLAHLASMDEDGKWRVRFDRLRRVMLGGVFAFGLAALQFFPVWSIRDYVIHGEDPSISTQYTIGQAAVNFVFPWQEWAVLKFPPIAMLESVDYAYVGTWTFLLIIFAAVTLLIVPNAQRRFPVNAAVLALVLALVMVAWGAGATPVMRWLYANVELLAEFRWIGRAHSMAALWWIVLAGLAVDVLWSAARDGLKTHRAFDSYDYRRLLRVMLVATLVWGGFLFISTRSDLTRANLTFYNLRLYLLLDYFRFRTYPDAALGLQFILLFALVVDTLFLLLEGVNPPRGRQHVFTENHINRRAYGTRLLRVGLLTMVLFAIGNVMRVNSGLFAFGGFGRDFAPLLEYAKAAGDGLPITAVREPFSPFMYSSYQLETRNWELNEGWIPGWVGGGVVDAEHVFDAPRWAINWNQLSDIVAPVFIEEGGYELRYCVALTGDELEELSPCDFDRDDPVAALYERPDVPPYAYVVPEDTLKQRGTDMRLTDVLPITTISHAQDTIIITAEAPRFSFEDAVTEDTLPVRIQPYYLVVQETHFPGWEVHVDGVPIEPTSVGRFLAVEMLYGEHTYTFRYQPPGLATGLSISLITLLAMGFYLRGGKQ